MGVVCTICNSKSVKEINRLYDDRYGYPGEYTLKLCNDCGHKFLDVNFSSNEIEKLYTDFYPRTERSLESFSPLEYKPGFKSWWRGEYRAFAAVPKNSRVLDIGCGFGESLAYHKSRNCDAYGVDADSNLLRVAEKFNFKVKIGPFDSKNYENNFFDYVTMDQVIEHFTDPIEILTGINRILKPGGYLIFTTPNSNGISAKINGKKWINWHTPYHLQHFSRKSLMQLGKKTGFILEKLSCVTSSEWAKYQKIHNVIYPTVPGRKAAFWSSGVEISEQDKRKIEKVNLFHNLRLNHLSTRIFDLLGIGDNFIGFYKKVN
ncbi:class I SAM-dependent methyltransferase [Leptospira sp. GIMC2001]|uniref:class I SAM-dependent methyltransferase n=1 Tax=Leptospira sp. GIMC2001 TaxID=1513297 RepID=UPI0023492269|nr:class I SAM-dependent methyltransferase [Leptospira sp. GIMC2001]WCL51266.1 class I SAM-dependent methyltransferase [Leptospira sp. GIMC2001]